MTQEQLPVPRKIYNRRKKGADGDRGNVLATRIVSPRGVELSPPEFEGRHTRYTRFSTEGQKERYSTMYQLDGLDDYAEDNGIVYSVTFSDVAEPGSTADRLQMIALLEDCSRHPGTTVVVLHMSRWAREFEIFQQLGKELRLRRCSLLVAMIGHVGSDEQAKEALASQLDYHNRQKDMTNGKATAIIDGRWVAAFSFGYYRGIDQKLYPDPDHAKVVKRIFNESAAGSEFSEIAAGLNHDGIATPAVSMTRKMIGIPLWTAGKVRDLVKKTCYKGEASQSVRIHPWEKGASPLGKQVTRYTLKYDEQRLVSDEVWEKAQAKPKHPKVGNGLPFNYLLVSKIMCPYCGLPFVIQIDGDRNGAHCRHIRKDIECPRVGYDYGVIEGLAWQLLREASGNARTSFTDSLRGELERFHAGLGHERRVAEEVILQLDRELDAAVRPSGNSLFEMRVLANLNLQELELKAKREALPPAVPAFEGFYERYMIDIGAVLDEIGNDLPFKPAGDAGVGLIKVATKAFKRVTLRLHDDGRGDVTFLLSGEPWGVAGFEFERTYTKVPVFLSNASRPYTEEAFAEDVRVGLLLPDAAMMQEMRRFTEFWRLFSTDRVDIVHCLRLATKYQWKKKYAFHQFGFKFTLINRLNTYLATDEGRELRKNLNEGLGLKAVYEGNYDKAGHIRTMRERLIVSKHPILRLPVLDPAWTGDPVTAGMWNALVADGLATHDGAFKGGKISDLRYFRTLMKVIRRNGRQDPLEEGEGSVSRLRELIRLLDRGLIKDVTISLLQHSGIEDIPHKAEVPVIADRSLNYVNPKPRSARPAKPEKQEANDAASRRPRANSSGMGQQSSTSP